MKKLSSIGSLSIRIIAKILSCKRGTIPENASLLNSSRLCFALCSVPSSGPPAPQLIQITAGISWEIPPGEGDCRCKNSAGKLPLIPFRGGASSSVTSLLRGGRGLEGERVERDTEGSPWKDGAGTFPEYSHGSRAAVGPRREQRRIRRGFQAQFRVHASGVNPPSVATITLFLINRAHSSLFYLYD